MRTVRRYITSWHFVAPYLPQTALVVLTAHEDCLFLALDEFDHILLDVECSQSNSTIVVTFADKDGSAHANALPDSPRHLTEWLWCCFVLVSTEPRSHTPADAPSPSPQHPSPLRDVARSFSVH